jgi:hypothetical protein
MVGWLARFAARNLPLRLSDPYGKRSMLDIDLPGVVARLGHGARELPVEY